MTDTDSIARSLQEVVVTAKQPATKLRGTTLVSTIAGSALQDLGTALDVLGQLPMINVADNAITITGKGAPEIYIDGRPMRSDDELMQLRSDNIRKVELDMAPGAMYAADTKAVLKITTRRSFVDGISFIERAEVTARRRWSANNMLDLNYRTGSWDIFAYGLIARNNSLIKGTTTNTLVYDGVQTVVGSSQTKSYPSTNGAVKAGFNYAAGGNRLAATTATIPSVDTSATSARNGSTPTLASVAKSTQAFAPTAIVAPYITTIHLLNGITSILTAITKPPVPTMMSKPCIHRATHPMYTHSAHAAPRYLPPNST